MSRSEQDFIVRVTDREYSALKYALAIVLNQRHKTIRSWKIFEHHEVTHLALMWHEDYGTKFLIPQEKPERLADFVWDWLNAEDYKRGPEPDTDGSTSKAFTLFTYGGTCSMEDRFYASCIIKPDWIIHGK